MPQSYRSRWLDLGEARAELVSKGPPTQSEAEDQIRRIVRDGVLPDTGNDPTIRLDHDDSPLRWWGGYGWDWLRGSPVLDFSASTILVPMPVPDPILTLEQKTLAIVSGSLHGRRPCRFVPVHIQIAAAIVDRLNEPTEVDSTHSEPEPTTGRRTRPSIGSAAAVLLEESGDNPHPMRRGRPPMEQSRVVAAMQKEIEAGRMTLHELEHQRTQDALASEFKTSPDSAQIGPGGSSRDGPPTSRRRAGRRSA
jgi:hypothetical protein